MRTSNTELLSPTITVTASGNVYTNPNYDTLRDLIAEHCRVYVLANGPNVQVASFPFPAKAGQLTVGTYVDRDASAEPAEKVFPFMVGSEAVAVETLDGRKVALRSIPAALRVNLATPAPSDCSLRDGFRAALEPGQPGSSRSPR